MPDRTQYADEVAWWDFWNRSHRTKDNNDVVSSELFERTAAVVNRITRSQSSRVLEIGCGTGTLSRLLNYSEYQGIDLSSHAIEIARQASETKARQEGVWFATYEAADFHQWTLPPQLSDVALCVDAIAYFYDQELVLRKIASSLRPSGKLVLTTINPFVYRRIKRTPTTLLREPAVSHWLSRRELHKLITAAGFAIECSRTIMPRGNCGVLRFINARRVNEMFGPRSAAALRRFKEQAGLGQYRLVVARKEG